MEYHNKCGYDKLHIFRGNLKTFDQTNRIARFCGPKQNGNNGHSKPYDGANKVYETAGVLPMWDEAFDTGSNEVIVAVDFDQGKSIINKILYLLNSKITMVYVDSNWTTPSNPSPTL